MTNPTIKNNKMLRWQKIRKIGKIKFSILFGLFAGIMATLGFALFLSLWPIDENENIGFVKQLSSNRVLFMFAFFTFFAIFRNYFLGWNQIENKYHKWLVRPENETASLI